jgi:hypothetical protein
MSGRQGYCLLVAILILVPAGAQAECTNYENYLHWVDSLEFVGNEPFGACAQGDYAIFSEGMDPFNIHVFDVSLAGNSRLVASLPMAKAIIGLSVDGDLLVGIAGEPDSTASVFVLDISDPELPTLIGECTTGHRYADVILSGQYAYAAGPEGYFDVIDISIPTSPQLVQTLDTGFNLRRLSLKDENLFAVAAMEDGLLFVELVSPGSVQMRGRYPLTDSWVIMDAEWIGIHVVTASRSDYYFQIWDFKVFSPTNFIRESTWGTPNPGNPQYFGEIATAGGSVYYAITTGYIYYFAHSTPNEVGIVGKLRGSSLNRMDVHEGNLYALRKQYWVGDTLVYNGWSHLRSVASTSPGEPIASINTPGESYAVVQDPNAKDTLLYVADGSAGLQIVDVTDPLAPQIIGAVDTPGSAVDIVVDGGLAYVADSGAGLQVIDVSMPTAPSIIGNYDTEGIAVKLDKVGDIAYVADTSWGLQLLDVSTPSTPFRRSQLDMPESANAVDVTVGGSLAHVAAEAQGLVVCNVSDPDNPWIIDDVKGGTRNITATKVDFFRDRVYVADGLDGMQVVDVSDTTNITLLGDVDTESTGEDVQVQGIFTYVCNGSGVNVVDCRDDNNLQVVGNMGVPATSRGIHLTEFYAYVANGDGIQVCPSQCGFDETAEAYFTPSIESGWLPDLEVTFTNESLGYGLACDWDFGDGMGTSTEVNPTYTYTTPGDYTVTLTVTNGVNQDTYSRPLNVFTDSATITEVTDVPDDQGGWVYVRFHRSGHDTDQLGRSESYWVQRRDAGEWVTAASSPAYGEGYYAVVVPTQGDGAAQYTTEFRVIAGMDEGTWASEVMTGFSEDNIAPAAPVGLLWSEPGVLAWDAAGEEDFAYFQVFGAEDSEFSNPVSVGVTVDPLLPLPVQDHAWFFVTAVDDYGLQSEVAAIQSNTSAVPDAAMATRLFAPVPNPFNPSTTMRFSLAEAGLVQLAVYDISGRRVRVLLDENRGGGSHAVTWNGRDDSGRGVAAGTYFCRLQAGESVEIQRMTLVK